MAEPFDPYAVLGVRRGASLSEIAHARRALAKSFHPDTAGAEGEQAMRRINLAWKMLSTDHIRTELQVPSWQRPDRGMTTRPPTASSSGGTHAGWWALALVGLLFVALLVMGIIGGLDGGTAPDAPWIQDNLGN